MSQIVCSHSHVRMNARNLAKLLENKEEDMLEVIACLVVYFISGLRGFNLWAAGI